MTEEKDLAVFHAYLGDEIRNRALRGDEGAEFEENAFVQIVTEHLAELGLFDEPTVCFHQGKWGNALFRLNGYAVSDERERIDLFIALYDASGRPSRVPHEDISRTAGYAARAIAAARRRIHEKMEKASDAYAMMSHIAELLSSGVKEVRVSVLTNTITSIKRIKPLLVENSIQVKFEAYDLKRLRRTMASGQIHDVIEIDLLEMGLKSIPCVAMPRASDGDYEAYLAVFPGESLFQMYETYGPRLLEYNVRAFLQATNKVNRGIRDTLKDDPQHFMAYNNGISITVDDVKTQRDTDGLRITHMKGLQIVNGGQTTASIHRARKRDRVDLSKVHVAAKITRLPSDRIDEMVPLISRYANTQNVIQEADFSSNEPFHIALERLSESLWIPSGQSRWFYERARGQYQTAMNKEGNTPAKLRSFRENMPPSQKFSKTDLGKFLNSWACLPNIVSGGAQKNFVAFMKSLREIRGDAWEPDEAFFREVIAKAIVFNTAVKLVRREGFPAYRANIVCYLVSYLSYRTSGQVDFEMLWKKQGISSSLESLLRVWSHSVAGAIQDSSGGRNVTEWCKKEDCWNAVKALRLPLPEKLPPELRGVI